VADPSTLDIVVELLGRQMAAEWDRACVFIDRGQHEMAARADGASCAVKDTLSVITHHREIWPTPARLREWNAKGRPQTWLPAIEGDANAR